MRRRARSSVWLAAAWLATSALPGCGRVGFELLGIHPTTDAEDTPDGGPPADAGGPESGRAADAAFSGDASSLDADVGLSDATADASTPDGTTDAAPPQEASLPDATREAAMSPADAKPSRDAETSVDSGASVCPGAKTWAFDFDSDPTLFDGDQDGVNDWVMRNATTFPISELDGGVWRSETRVVLDTRPMDDFATRTVVDVRMRSVAVPTTGRGAVFWVNLNEGGPTFSALFVSVALEADGGQTLTLFGKDGTAEVALATLQDLPEGFVDVHLDIDPAAHTVALDANGIARGTLAIPETGAPNADHFATLLLWDGIAEFDSVRIQRCARD